MSTYYCRLCYLKSQPEESLLISIYIADIIQFCIPEVDMKLVNNPVVCTGCFDKLETMVKFKKKCLEVQENIKEVLSNVGVQGEGVDLSTVLDKISSTLSDPNENTRIECLPESSVVSENNEAGSLNIYFLSNSSDADITSVSSIDIKTEVDGPTSTICDSSNNSINSSTTKRPAAESVSRKPKLVRAVKNVVDIQLSKKHCHTCSLPLKSSTELIHHLYTEHQKDDEMYICLLCRYKTSRLLWIENHYSNSHSNCVDLYASCIFCSTHMDSFKELFQHMSEEHKSICQRGKYYCNSCDYFTESYFNFKKHFFLSHDLICNYCLKNCENLSVLNKHLRTHLCKWNRNSVV